ncbi:MBL fold metallo-hydrolase [Corynebacterium guangdongense]|uniref:Glyoxylase-like metal-dependent hydrolase (Beta-lactamase superfamily II) n=1 Tax=Corynebacterium guangdongense TaxID=1783348 RepID=A0ABU1ZYJ2_9CORY|nr:MBL fold metallo-hydrolase [Corynebacterium guangdongense]MDR7328953.1 glyoxylase-like metal-dependent hydrolase (beta-lactamase superfamily II) [Corynebacterium guangdongense]WJZ17526.1 putative metallo-hydrolase YflN [Corynebacterium guangdongense]
MQIAPHLYRLGNDIIASYLISLPEGVTLIDAGLPGHWGDLVAQLDALDRPVTDVRGLILTHGHYDHIGFAERLRQEAAVPVYVHSEDSQLARTGRQPGESGVSPGPFRLGPLLQFYAYGLRKNGMRPRYLGEVVEISSGAVLDLPGEPRIIGLPGHSPGSVALHVPALDAVFVGDALTTRHVLTGRTAPQPSPFTAEPEQADASLSLLADIPASWVLPGHGAPWRGSPADLVDKVRAFPG